MNRKKITPFFKIGSLALSFFFLSFSLFAEEEVLENLGSEVVVIPHISISQVIDYHTRDLESLASDIGLYEAPIYLTTDIKGYVDITKGDFTFSPFFQERLDTYFDKTETSPSVSESEVTTRLINRFYVGFDLKYDFQEIMYVVVSTQFRIESDLKESLSSSPDLLFRFAPIVALSGDYSFGLTWSASQMFGILFDKDSLKRENPLSYTYYKGDFSLTYEFLHFFPEVKNQKAFVFAMLEYGYSDFFNPNSYYFSSNFSLGLKYSANGLTPALGMHIWSDHDGDMDKMVAVGFHLGMEYKIKDFVLSALYTGGDDVMSSGFEWESKVSTSITYSM